MNIVANWSYPTPIKLGRGRIKELADACKTLGIKKPLLVTDRGLAGMAITGHALDILDEAGLGRAIFSDVEIAAVANYVSAHFGSGAAHVTPADVADLRRQAAE